MKNGWELMKIIKFKDYKTKSSRIPVWIGVNSMKLHQII